MIGAINRNCSQVYGKGHTLTAGEGIYPLVCYSVLTGLITFSYMVQQAQRRKSWEDACSANKATNDIPYETECTLEQTKPFNVQEAFTKLNKCNQIKKLEEKVVPSKFQYSNGRRTYTRTLSR